MAEFSTCDGVLHSVVKVGCGGGDMGFFGIKSHER